MRIRTVPFVVALGLALSSWACRPDDQRTDTIDPTGGGSRGAMSPQAVAQLDSGNAAYRAGNHQEALTHYRRVTELEPDQSPGWFGLHMANLALGNRASADSALERVQSLAPGASLIHPTAADTLP